MTIMEQGTTTTPGAIPVLTVRKRDGRALPFDTGRIRAAITKGFVEVHGEVYVVMRERDVHAVAAERLEAGSTGLYL